MDDVRNKIIGIAKVCHDANKSFCETMGDMSQPSWEDAPDWQRDSAVDGVIFQLGGQRSLGDSHQNWMDYKFSEGWKYGPVKDVEKKEHPSLVPFEELPWEERFKDALFLSVVMALSPIVAEVVDRGVS